MASSPEDLRTAVAGAMPALVDELCRLVSIPSVAFPGAPSEPVLRMADATVDLLRRSGCTDARLVPVPDGYPAVFGEVPGPPGSPTVLLYAHYDVQPAPASQGWGTDPWTPVLKDDGRLYGRGAADDKSGIVLHAGALQAWGGSPPVTVKVLIEGEEETLSHLDAFVEANPDLVRCDAIVVADMGNATAGQPGLTTALRGEVSCVVTVRTLDRAVHSGLFGGVVPDAVAALVRTLASLHDDDGNVAVEGLHQFPWPDESLSEADVRTNSGTLDGVQLIGSPSELASRSWSRPSITTIGIDAPSTADASNVLLPEAAARISLRIAPGADPERELQVLMDHLRSHVPWGAQVEVRPLRVGPPFQVDTSHPAFRAAERALGEAFQGDVAHLGSGGSIPLIATLQAASPEAGVVLFGAEDLARSRIHGGNESVSIEELERCVLAEALLLRELSET